MALSILLVEDNVLNQELAYDLLEASGHTVDIVDDAEGFRERIAGNAVPDIILMDVLLPGTDGRSLLRELREAQRLPQVPVVAITAQALAGDVERLLMSGFDAVITKPIDTRTFVGAVEEHARAGRRSSGGANGQDPNRR